MEVTDDHMSRNFRPLHEQVSPLAVALVAALTMVVLAPVGYVGGGWDDRHYLEAAQCAASNGFCMPDDHWGRRFPLVIPAGLALAVFGESRQALWAAPLLYSFASVAFFTLTVQRTFGRRPALIAGFLFAVTPAFSERILHFGVDIAEFAFLAAAAFCIRMSMERRTWLWVVLSGLAVSLAVLTRPTSLAMLPVFAAAFVLSGQAQRLILFSAAFTAPLILEAIGYWQTSGDPFLSWRLSLAHTTIPSSELPAGIDLSESPLFNIGFIDSWRPAAGIELHWTVDAFVNLLASGAMLVLPFALALLVLHRWSLGKAEAGGQTLLLLVGAASVFFAVLVFGFAIDPKPRMFLPVAAIACVVCGVLGALSWRRGQHLLVLGMAAAIGLHASVSAIVRVDGDPITAAFGPLIP